MGFPRILSNNNKVYTKLGEFCLSGDGNHFWIVCHTCQMELQTQDHFWKHIQDEHSFMHTKKQEQKRWNKNNATFIETETMSAQLPFPIQQKFSQPKESTIASSPEYDSDEHKSILDIPVIDANAVEVKVEPEIVEANFYENFPHPSNENKTNDEVASTSDGLGKRKQMDQNDCKANNRLSNTERDENATSPSSSTSPPEGSLIDQSNFSPCNKLMFLSGKYYRILKTVTDTEHQKKATGIIAACHNCKIEIRGYLQISSNFLSHMKTKHPERYQEFLDSKEQSRRINHELKRKYKQQNHNWTWSY